MAVSCPGASLKAENVIRTAMRESCAGRDLRAASKLHAERAPAGPRGSRGRIVAQGVLRADREGDAAIDLAQISDFAEEIELASHAAGQFSEIQCVVRHILLSRLWRDQHLALMRFEPSGGHRARTVLGGDDKERDAVRAEFARHIVQRAPWCGSTPQRLRACPGPTKDQ